MIHGIGVDMVDVERVQKIITTNQNFIAYTFTSAEQELAQTRKNRAVFYATRFAAKEAVFKALAHNLKEKTFDLRLVETLNREDGSPYINTELLQTYLDELGAKNIHISLSDEIDKVIAFVVITS